MADWPMAKRKSAVSLMGLSLIATTTSPLDSPAFSALLPGETLLIHTPAVGSFSCGALTGSIVSMDAPMRPASGDSVGQFLSLSDSVTADF
ncbi:hypothetical protein D3C81_1843920 [compost metagenome]